MTSSDALRWRCVMFAAPLLALSVCQIRPAAQHAQPGATIEQSVPVETQAKPGGRTMIELSRQTALEDPVRVEVAARPISPARSPAVLAAASPVAGAACPQPYANAEMNSRLPAPLPAGAWRIRWQTSTNSAFRPSFVTQDGDRILEQGEGLWQLFDLDGKAVANGRYGPSFVVLDAQHSMFYLVDSNNFIVGYRLGDGKKQFMTPPAFSRIFARPLLARRGNRLLIVGVEQEGYPHRPSPPNQSVVEFKELGDRLEVDSSGLLMSLTSAGKLLVNTSTLFPAMGDETVVFAVPGRIYMAALDLTMKGALEADFEPLGLSLDEAGRIYLLARTDGRLALWLVTPQGEQLMSFDIAPNLQPGAVPIIGYDHRVYLLAADRVLCVGADGKLAWEHVGHIGGAGVTADNQLLGSAGTEVAAFDKEGKRKVLFTFGESIVTPPVMTAAGDILVASQNKLYCLAAR